MKNAKHTVRFPGRFTNRQLLVVLLSEQAVLKSRIQLIESMLRNASELDAAALDEQLAALIKASCDDLGRRVKEYSSPA